MNGGFYVYRYHVGCFTFVGSDEESDFSTFMDRVDDFPGWRSILSGRIAVADSAAYWLWRGVGRNPDVSRDTARSVDADGRSGYGKDFAPQNNDFNSVGACGVCRCNCRVDLHSFDSPMASLSAG